jgi:hypothetical protein
VCGPAEELDVSPCIAESTLRLDNRLLYLEPDGTIRFVEQLTSRASVALARRGQRLIVLVSAGNQAIAALDWRLRFATPNDIALGGDGDGQVGPDLYVRVEQLPTGRVIYEVHGPRDYVAIVERDQATMFHVTSQGGDGARGRDGLEGLDGLPGPPGSNAYCPSTPAGDGGRGGDGSTGEDGGPGDPGGDGGNVQIEVRTSGTPPDEVLALTKKTVLSRGGSGGSGGSGGNGGRGGSGGSAGSGATCVDSQGIVTTLNSGAQGFNGSDGRSGSMGWSGANGREGRITIRVLR